jgi:hypothetical protein
MEAELLEHFIHRLKSRLGIHAEIKAQHVQAQNVLVHTRLILKRKQYQQDWYVEVKREITPAMVPHLLHQFRDVTHLLLLAEYITPAAKQLLQQEHVAYADAAGNLYLEDGPLYLHIEAYKAERTQATNAGRAFTKTGLKLLFVLLVHPEYLNMPYRVLAEKAGVGLDTINKVYKALLEDKYIIAINEREYKWNKREELLLRWVSGYNTTLRPKLNQRTFRTLNRDIDWQEIELPQGTVWGGANAGDLLAGNLIPDEWVVYTSQDFKALTKDLKWVPDAAGNIKVLEKFWYEEGEEKQVPPLLAYADLIATNDPRYLETAKKIYETELQYLI